MVNAGEAVFVFANEGVEVAPGLADAEEILEKLWRRIAWRHNWLEIVDQCACC